MSKAMVSYERALLWRDLFDLALREGVQREQLAELAHRVSGSCV